MNLIHFLFAKPAERAMPWLTLSVLALAIHGVLSWNFASAGWTTSCGVGLMCSVALALSLVRARHAQSDLRLRWLLLASAFVLWIIAYADIAYLQSVVDADSSHALPFVLIFALRGIPWLIAMSGKSTSTTGRYAWIFNGLQSSLFAVAVTFLFFPYGVRSTLGMPTLSSQTAASYHDWENFALAGLSVVATLLQPSTRQRRFAINLSGLLVSYALSAYVVNHGIIEARNPAPGAPVFLLLNLPLVVFVLMVSIDPHQREENRALAGNSLKRILAMLAPSIMASASLLLSFAVAALHPRIGLYLGIATLLTYALRSALTQIEFLRVQAELRRARDEMEALSNQDALTGLANRRYFDRIFAAAFERARRQQQNLALLFVDIDAFKSYNDAWGHVVGDACLRRVAATISAQLQGENDLAARYGGEEFVVLLESVSGEAAEKVAERIRAAVRKLDIPHPLVAEGYVSVSIGVACSIAAATTPQAMLEAADQSLYRAKRNGRNRVCSSRDNPALDVYPPIVN